MSEHKEIQAILPSKAILAVIASFLLSLFLGTAFAILVNYGISMVLGELLLMIVPLGYMLSKKVDVKKYIGLEINFKSILLGIAIGVFLVFFDIFVTNIMVSMLGQSEIVEESNKLMMDMSRSTEGLILIIATLTSAGLCEEFTFRGFLQTAINNKYSSWIALITSSLAFGFVHFDPQGVYTISAFFMGLVLGYVYHRWRSYTVSATAHATLNLIILSLMLLLTS
ncbi:MAG: CPBP family glutamic-type intramembrane protease [Candidatus Bathycorpusculaceae bacterium]